MSKVCPIYDNSLYWRSHYKSDFDNCKTPEDSLNILKKGNTRFITGHSQHPHSDINRVAKLANSQHPHIATLSCSDSRVAPEIIFDQGLGDIFEVKNAGNVLDKASIGSLEYAVSHLGVNLVVVMGHDDCGAVKASVKNKKQESKYLSSITDYIHTSVKKVNKKSPNYLHDVTEENCKTTVKNLIKKSKIINNAVQNNQLKVIPAMYDIKTGNVDFYA